jgi:anaerobic ribonucleoside-triphosphate reductase activating protein
MMQSAPKKETASSTKQRRLLVNESTLRLFGTVCDSIVDGPGLRFSVFVQGCAHACPGCHNLESQDYAGGHNVRVDELFSKICENKLICGVTLSGGEPLDQSATCLLLVKQLKEAGQNVWLYTGYRIEEVLAGALGQEAIDLVKLCDVVVDGPFVQDLFSHTLRWKGSSNQRVIDMQKTIAAQPESFCNVVLWESQDSYPSLPFPW